MVLCPLCGQWHLGIDRVHAAIGVMLEQVHAYETQQRQLAALLRPPVSAPGPGSDTDRSPAEQALRRLTR
jgi:hypothetical protein